MEAAVRAGGGKAKGAQFERDVCSWLSKWLTGGRQDDVFWRSAMSGGRATLAAKKGGKRLANQVGDITCIDPVGMTFISRFGVECKHYADLDYIGLLTGRGKLLAFWAEIGKQAAAHNKYPFLVAKQNRQPASVCLSGYGMRTLGLTMSQSLIIGPKYDVYIFDADWFFKTCKPYLNKPQSRARVKLNAKRSV